jgi:hypothetical protein
VNRNVPWYVCGMLTKRLSLAVNILAETDIKLTVNRNGPLYTLVMHVHVGGHLWVKQNNSKPPNALIT